MDAAREAAVAALAATQYGLLTVNQAVACGFPERTVRNRCHHGRWHWAGPPGVIAMPGTPESWRRVLWAHVLGEGPNAVASHRSAAAIWRIPGFDGGDVEVSKAHGRNRRLPNGRIHGSLWLPEHHVTVRHAIPVTTPARTIFDLAGWVHERRTERALDNALSMKLTTMDKVAAVLVELACRGRRGTTLMRRLCEKRGIGYVAPDSELEAIVLEVLDGAGLPRPEQQIRLGDSVGLIGRVDFLYRRARVIIEADGWRWHSSELDTAADKARDAAFRAAGWTVIRVRWHEVVNQPWLLVRELRQALEDAAR